MHTTALRNVPPLHFVFTKSFIIHDLFIYTQATLSALIVFMEVKRGIVALTYSSNHRTGTEQHLIHILSSMCHSYRKHGFASEQTVTGTVLNSDHII